MTTAAILDQLVPLLTHQELQTCAQQFHQELDKALTGVSSSLPCILNPIARSKPLAGFGVAVSIGGTNGYASAFRISEEGSVRFVNRVFFPLPLKSTKEELFKLIAHHVFSVANGRKKPFPIGIGFAYPLKPLLHHGFIDGELLSMSKERDIDGLVGKRVGQEFHRFLIREYQFDTTVAVANDAICLLLGGNGADVAGVLGTGLNFAYWEKRAAIASAKLQDLAGFSEPEVAINTESAEFDKVPATKLRDIVDAQSPAGKGTALAEKETAGVFLYQIFNAGKDAVIDKEFPRLESTDQINDIMTGAFPFPVTVTPEQQKQARAFADRIFHRSAQIIAAELCGILMKVGKTEGIVPVVMEGGIFWKAKNYTSLVNLYVNMIFPDMIPSFARLFGSSRRGIAILAVNGTRGLEY